MLKLLTKSILATIPGYHKKLLTILLLTLASVVVELISIGTIIPILSIFVDSDYLKYTKYLFFVESKSKEEIFIIILGFFLFIYFCKFFLLRYLIHAQNDLTNKMQVDISNKLFENYLYKNFLFHVKHSSSELIRNIQTEAAIFSFQVIFPSIRFLSEIIIFLFIMVALMFFNLKASLVVIFFFVVIGYALIKFTSIRLKHWGQIRHLHASQTLKQLQQSFSSIKEVIINNLQQVFLKKYHIHNLESAIAGKNRDTTVQMPRLILELLGVTTFVILIVFLLNLGMPISEIFVIIGVFFFAAIRLLPAVSSIVKSIQSLKFNEPVIKLIYEELIDYKKNELIIKQQRDSKEEEKINLKKITLKEVSFSYPNSKQKVFDRINFEINANDKIGIIGKTGTGKTTLLNLITGLIDCNEGKVIINDTNIDNLKLNWQRMIGYVPQLVSILDENILFNVTLEDDEKKINLSKFNEVLKIVDLHDHIYNLPNNIYELAGERGAKLSGGQCQRIGIARALYKDPKILILDEATSSLDASTEEFILDNLFRKMINKTIVTISHRKSSIKYCNKIIEIKNNQLNKLV